MTSWFITGTATGLDHTLTRRLLERGDTVAVARRHAEGLGYLRARHGDRLWTRELDVTDTVRLRQVVDAAFADLGRIDVVLFDTGVGPEPTDSGLAASLIAGMHLARTVVPHLRDQGGGRFAQVAVHGGRITLPGFAIHPAAEWALGGVFDAGPTQVSPAALVEAIVALGDQVAVYPAECG